MTASQNRPSSTHRLPLVPRSFPSSGFETIAACIKVEEETLPFYDTKIFYPVCVGDVLRNQYQVVAKLGYGTSSTTWLCHDLVDHRYVTLKMHINTLTSNRELGVYQHLKGVKSDHPGQKTIRMLEESFKLQGPHGTHDIFVLPPLGISVGALQDLMPGEVFDRAFVVDVHAGNLLIGIRDESFLSEFEDAEFANPSSRKLAEGVTIHLSQLLLAGPGPLYLCDFGEARIGSQHEGIAMPIPYRAPEILLDMKWGHSVDMWSLGLLAWDLLEPESLFQVYNTNDKALNEAHHLANMISIIGPPPLAFLERSRKSCIYWDENGNWRNVVPIPVGRTLESLEKSSKGDDKFEFLRFIRALLCWLPEERLTTAQAYIHPWLSASQNPASTGSES